jgi:hypothetical protein
MLLRWIASLSASCCHAAAALARGRTLADARLDKALREPALTLGRLVGGEARERDRRWDELTALAAGVENNRELAELYLKKSKGRSAVVEADVSEFAAAIAGLEAAALHAIPGMVDELAARAGPLKLHWEARGPGLLAAVGRMAEANLIAPRADVVLVHPALGGSGAAHLPYNSVRIEAVLTHPLPELPETVRLAWLLAQLQLDLPLHSEHLPGDHLPRLAALAMLPPVLAAAEEVELTTAGRDWTPLAVQHWLGDSEPDHEQVARVLAQWWSTHQTRRPSMAVALGALDEMLAADR